MPRKRYNVNYPKPGSHKFNLIGLKFGLLTVESYFGLDNSSNKLWLCKCDCGNTCKVTTTSLRKGKTTSCKCNQYKKGCNVYNYTGYKDITGTKWNSIKNNAKIRGLDFKITKEFIWELFLKQNRRCFLTNMPISYENGTASVDRITSSKGYLPNNIILVHKDVNLMRNKFSIEYFKTICNKVIKNDNI